MHPQALLVPYLPDALSSSPPTEPRPAATPPHSAAKKIPVVMVIHHLAWREHLKAAAAAAAGGDVGAQDVGGHVSLNCARTLEKEHSVTEAGGIYNFFALITLVFL